MSEKKVSDRQRIEELLGIFSGIAASPKSQLDMYTGLGKKAVGVFPYYAPEELVHAAGFIPLGIWGASGTVREAGRYFPAFYCTIARMGLELALTGVLDRLSAVVMPTLCDTLRPLSQNFKAARPDIPMLFLAQPQNRKTYYGKDYYVSELMRVKGELEALAGKKITDEALYESVQVYNESRAERRRFVQLAAAHASLVSTQARSAALKSAYFTEKREHQTLLKELNDLLAAQPAENPRDYTRVVTSGILADGGNLLKIFDEQGIRVAADDVAHESRSFRVDVPESLAAEAPMYALAEAFAQQTDDSLLWEADLSHRQQHLIDLVLDSGARGVVFLMMQFCDPEELDYPSLKAALDTMDIPSIQIGYDQQMTDFGQAETQLMTFKEIIG